MYLCGVFFHSLWNKEIKMNFEISHTSEIIANIWYVFELIYAITTYILKL